MAFKNGLSERLDELRFPSPRSPPSESTFPGYNALSPSHSNFVSAFSRPSHDVRANLQRRFTTDSSKVSSSWTYINGVSGGAQAPDPLDLLSSFEKKRQHIEYMREQRRRFEEDMKLLDLQHEKEKLEMDQIAKDLAKAGLSGPVSEPTTPPEYHESSLPGFTRPTRFSTSSVTSSPGFFNVFAPSQVTTPPSQVSHSSAQTPTNRFSVHSVPGSRRNSEKEEFSQEPASPFRPGPSIHRYSMPSSGLGSQIRPNITSFERSSGLESFNAAKYLFHNEDDRSTLKDDDRIPTPDIKSYLKLTDPDDKFPTLSRRDDSGLLSANSDALDLANSRTPNPETWNSHSRHRTSHQSMPQNALNMFRLEQLGASAEDIHSHSATPARHTARHSLEANILYTADGNNESLSATALNRPTSLQSSYSTNDLPTVKGDAFNPAITPPRTHAEQFQQHNASLGRIPGTSPTNRLPKDSPEHEAATLQGTRSQPITLQASAAPFGPQLTTGASTVNSNMAAPTTLTPFQQPFYGYGIQPFMAPAQIQAYNPTAPFSGYPAAYGNFRLGEAPVKVSGTRRSGDTDTAQLSRFTNFPLEHYRGELYGLCKDQHGCRYLQRKLEERNPEHVQMIFDETHVHVVELMTDPFGNYLCQKLLEYSNDDQRTALINNAAHQLVKIALNQHGTRALQKMIEFISTSEQTQTVIHALKDQVVELVQDLNGNHVIQKCLNRLSAEDAQFIYDAVGANCVVVGTHRHGCCVLQRCIDHASGDQRANLIHQITNNAFALVQDPFGNYVVQYILDLAEPSFTEPLCQTFRGNIPALSKQKFSSNVIEKCLRTADVQVRRQLIDEMLAGAELEKMLRDSFANYVVQTAMDFADADTRTRIVDCIRPILPSIRQTPHGRRIAGKMLASDGSGRGSATTSGQVTPNEVNSAQLPGPLQSPTQKSFLYQHSPFPVPNVGSQFGNQTYAYAPGSVTATHAGAGDNPSHFASAMQQPGGSHSTQNPAQISSPSSIVVHGISATCKTTIVRHVLAALEIPHALVRSPECITGRHLLTKILWATLEALGKRDEWEKYGKGRCEHVSSLAVLLNECLASVSSSVSSTEPAKRTDKFVLVLDGIDKQREAPPTLLPALARLGEVIPSLCVVLILSTTPRPLFLQSAGVPHISFPPYTRNEATAIILHGGPPPVTAGLSDAAASTLYPHFVSAIYDSLVGPTASSIPSFRSICEKLWPRFVAPITTGEIPPGGTGEWDFTRLLVKNRALFRHQGEGALVHHIVTEEDGEDVSAVSSSKPRSLSAASAPSPLPSLPYFPTLILTSAYLASHTPQRLDTIFFSKFSSTSLSARNKRAHHRRRLKLLSRAQLEEAASSTATPGSRKKGKRTKTKITKSTLESAFATSSATTSAVGGGGGITGPSTILTARPFPLERLVAIYHAIDPNPPANPIRMAAVSDAIYAELATLRRLRLVVPAAGREGRVGALGSGGLSSGNTTSDAGEKWCVNVSGDWIGELAKTVGVEVGEWLAGGLD
ncbi:putative RNA-binding protein [Aspergillus homomorphus CBS 101889]|uniref:PUM-HD domain-containing protein n=1 Tax=Aspergillus homomorphus (strain CBS 101889) TaxID=1450537 RepID=A0A395HXG0_ASPHC|nr:hypothetical protein BO97DRAFT_345782 [Aspergillus homomorphus CBS 101889]RAL12083.1 hypothetical protein BO97DRAFT_345782 [Aspergillus homomorphus CBS 101889]